eukprot:5767253-Amphidinium_carterae.1
MRVFDVKRLLEHVSDDLHRYAEYHSVSSDFKHICRRDCPKIRNGVDEKPTICNQGSQGGPNLYLLLGNFRVPVFFRPCDDHREGQQATANQKTPPSVGPTPQAQEQWRPILIAVGPLVHPAPSG